eukprot:CAMPEP_0171918340 /NCGR_PEP_ID=MMETSP0993-20121228/17049_1 /TAXON_ID=483369 /ORGANISM="non described non described, Strain CCMP2098" /LENGTH=59 /DNA_ID=CAMNT_0012554617 /DNA_START=224 /DNA_END=400 /DNA_ORIENTATION=-
MAERYLMIEGDSPRAAAFAPPAVTVAKESLHVSTAKRQEGVGPAFFHETPLRGVVPVHA